MAVTLAQIKAFGKKAYEREIAGLGTFELCKLTHGFIRDLRERHIKDGVITDFPAWREAIIEAGTVNPKITAKDMDDVTEDVLEQLYRTIGEEAGLLNKPNAEANPTTPSTTSSSS